MGSNFLSRTDVSVSKDYFDTKHKRDLAHTYKFALESMSRNRTGSSVLSKRMQAEYSSFTEVEERCAQVMRMSETAKFPKGALTATKKEIINVSKEMREHARCGSILYATAL